MNAHGSYFASLSLQLKAKHGDLFDAQLFAPLLASVVAHEKNIIIRTVEEDITRVCNAASHVSPEPSAGYLSLVDLIENDHRCYLLSLGSPPIE